MKIIPFEDIEFVLKRRYTYKRKCVEIYVSSKKSYTFLFKNSEHFSIFFLSLKTYLKDVSELMIDNKDFDDNVGFVNKRSSFITKNHVFYEGNNSSVCLNDVYKRWMSWEISNLHLLMIFNILGNRSYNDVNQYPVFPWILVDYGEKDLDKIVNSPKSFIRPLNTPIPMLESTSEALERKENFIDNWKSSEKDKEEEDTIGRYCTHYSTSLYVTYFLVRIFPFSSIRLSLPRVTTA